MLDAPRITLKAHPARSLPVEAMVLGKPRSEVAELLPRLFNLCRAAQSIAVRHALDLNGAEDVDALRREIIRDHVLRLTVVLPGHFGIAPIALPAGWQEGGDPLRAAVFGRTGHLPERVENFNSYLRSGEGLGGLWARIDALFDDGDAETDVMPYVGIDTGGDPKARVENSCALRVADHPVVSALGTRRRTLLWRLVARSYDLQALLDGHVPTVDVPRAGLAHVPATRGLYTVKAAHDGDRVTAFARVTPTDHLQAPGGVLDQTLASLPATGAGLVPLIMDVLDPCAPIRVEEVSHA